MVIEGDPGMGKTRLLEELEHESMAQNQPDVEGTPSSHGDLSAIRKMCNIFAANRDLANKSKVHTRLSCTPGASWLACINTSVACFHAMCRQHRGDAGWYSCLCLRVSSECAASFG